MSDEQNIAENLNKILSELKKINKKCKKRSNKQKKIIKEIGEETKRETTQETKANQTENIVIETQEVSAGYIGPQTNRSNNRWISSLRNPFSFYLS